MYTYTNNNLCTGYPLTLHAPDPGCPLHAPDRSCAPAAVASLDQRPSVSRGAFWHLVLEASGGGCACVGEAFMALWSAGGVVRGVGARWSLSPGAGWQRCGSFAGLLGSLDRGRRRAGNKGAWERSAGVFFGRGRTGRVRTDSAGVTGGGSRCIRGLLVGGGSFVGQESAFWGV